MQDQIEEFFEIVFNALGWFDPAGRHSFVKDIPSAYPAHEGGFWIGEIDNKIAGTVAIRLLDKSRNICELKRMYVLPEYQGKGYGKLLLAHAIEKAKSYGYEFIRLDATKSLVKAILLYRKFGFYEIERYNDNIYAQVFMEAKIL
jgi:putative acetyltransferase